MDTICNGLAVEDPAQAAALYGAVAAWLEAKPGFEDLRPPPLQLHPPHWVRREVGGPALSGMARRTVRQGPEGVLIEPDGVIIRSGLPVPIFQMVAAHELGHVWVARAQIPAAAPAEEEGFCQLLAHLWLGERGGHGRDGLIRQIETMPDPVYGDGFRMMKARADTEGLPALLRAMAGRAPAHMPQAAR